MYNSDFNDTINVSYCAFALNFMDVRVQQPIEAMRMLGANVYLHERKILLPSDLPANEPKIFILQRSFLSKEGWPQTVATAIKRGWLMVVEYDDYPENPFNAEKRANSLDWERFKMCHAVQASTKPLADAFAEHNPEVGLFQNHIYKRPPSAPRKHDHPRIFFGALNRKTAWQPLLKTYNKVLKANPEAQAVVLHDKEFFAALETDNKVFKPTANYDDYMKILHSCDICLQPLDDTKFNRYKSDIKYLEAGIGGLAVIASPVVYDDYIEHERTGLIARSPKDWEQMLTKLIRNKDYRASLGTNAKRYVLKNRMLMQHAHKRLDWYRHLWANRKALNERLFTLYPQLKP
jgi:hypothetical protein